MKMLIIAKPGDAAEVHLCETAEDMMKVLFKGSPPKATPGFAGIQLHDILHVMNGRVIDVAEFTDHRPIKT